ncbi:hypothetical protein BGZ60DRAFT_227558 [Tricladium varicosporioides]|nr:hypothetical protein BGZ60DRAFT_227558 [Hymenoscyphus varicosporioides]
MVTVKKRVVVGIDLGQTGTGVSILSTHSKCTNGEIIPVSIKNWPNSPGKVFSKVPTRVTYRAGDLRVPSWGFSCPQRTEVGDGMRVVRLFKFLFDRQGLDKYNHGKLEADQETMENVHKWITDFLTKLREYIDECLSAPPWNVVWGDTIVEYIFSLPTSWDSLEYIAGYESLITRAGFGNGKNCSMKVGLTEANAAAVYTAKKVNHEFVVGDVILSCDAGGMTSDICALRVSQIENEATSMEALLSSICIFNGSLQIDEAFKNLLETKIAAQNIMVEESAIYEVVDGEFQDVKALWGTNLSPPISVPLRVRGRSNDSNGAAQRLDDTGISIKFLKTEIDEIFDSQVDQILAELDGALDRLERMHPPMQVSAIFLSGGLGSSAYLQNKVIEHYQGISLQVRFDSAKGEPPLSVCNGLVYNRIQELTYNLSAYRVRRCAVSYGLLCDPKWATSHRNAPANRGDVRKQIKYFIVQGDEVTEGVPIIIKRFRETDSRDPDTAWVETIVMSKSARDSLPHFLGDGDSEEVGIVSSTADRNTLVRKRRYYVGKRVLEGKYKIWVQLEHENLKVETRVKGMLTGEKELTQVQWTFD